MPMVRRMAESGACSQHSLAGLRVLVTRARHQSTGLVTLIEQHGGTAIRFPVIEILPPRDARSARAAMARLDDFALVIFVSPNAVEHGLAMLDRARVAQTRAAFAAVGESTAAALAQAGLSCVLRPAHGASSEALLALAELGATAVAGSEILIVRGEGGRQLLGDTLSKRGARVTYAEVYRRAAPTKNRGGLRPGDSNGGIDTIVITSLAGIENLFAMLGPQAVGWLQEAGYVVVSERLAAHARALGIKEQPVIAAGADDRALLEALRRWRAAHPGDGK
jgi:uroporphyrinogen-III synthase